MNWIEVVVLYWKDFSLVLIPTATWFVARKSRDIKLKTEGAGAISALQNIYDKYIEHNSSIMQELSIRLNQVEDHNRSLQKNFNDMSISYSVVMGESKKFEAKYNLLMKEYEQLKVDHEKLLRAFNKYKEENK